MRLTKQTGHAIRILVDCARSDGALVKVADIAKRLDITKQNVFKIVHLLSRAGFIAAVRGPAGGVRLAQQARDIRIGDVVRAIEVTRVTVDGSEKASTKADDSQPLNAVFDDALGAFIAVLDQHTLEELSLAPVLDDTPGARKKAPASKVGSARRTSSRR